MTPLSQILTPERIQKKTAKSASGSLLGPDLTIPLLGEQHFGPTTQPALLVTNARGEFVLSKVSKEGVGRYGFSEVDLEDEGDLLYRLYMTGAKYSAQFKWGNLSRTPEVGTALLASFGYDPKCVILSSADHAEAPKQNGLVIILADLPKGAAIISTLPSLVGIYARSGDYVGIQIVNPHQTMVFVCPPG
jgi:hypothetical protein